MENADQEGTTSDSACYTPDSHQGKTSPDASCEPREQLIQTAVKFLQNPKVRQSDFAQRRAFLEKKGLTKQEIDIAVERSGTAADEHQTPVQPSVTPQYGGPTVQSLAAASPMPVSTWSRIRDWIATIMVVGGVAYAAYKLYKRYIESYLFGPSKEEKQMEFMQRSILELEKNIGEMLKCVRELQGTITKQQGNIQESSLNDGQLRATQHSNEIKEEIKSLKALLLSRKQFPSTPATNPVIPSWQLGKSSLESTGDASKPTAASSAPNVRFGVQQTQPAGLEMPVGLESTPVIAATAAANATWQAESSITTATSDAELPITNMVTSSTKMVAMANEDAPESTTKMASNVAKPTTTAAANAPELASTSESVTVETPATPIEAAAVASNSVEQQVNGEIQPTDETNSGGLGYADDGEEVKTTDT